MIERCTISPTARQTLGRLTREEWLIVSRMIDNIIEDPVPDNVHKFVINRPPIVYRLYYDPPFQIAYRLYSPVEIRIMTIRPADPVPPLSDWDDWLKR